MSAKSIAAIVGRASGLTIDEAAAMGEAIESQCHPTKRKPPRRISRPHNLTLTPAASAALAALTARPGGDNASREASAAILAQADALGVALVVHPGATPPVSRPKR